MNPKEKKFFISVVFLLISFSIFAQKTFQVTFKFPIEFNTNKVKIFYNNGKEWKKAKTSFIENEVTVSDSFYSRYAVLSCTYSYNGKSSSYGNSFFIGDSLALIVFDKNDDTLSNPFLNSKLTNVYDINKIEEAKQLVAFTKNESVEYNDFLTIFGDKINTNDSLNKISRIMYKKLIDKEIKYIKQNGSSYYLLWFFQNRHLNYNEYLGADSLLKIFESTFVQELKNTFEGNQIISTLRRKANLTANYYSEYFKSVDCKNKTVDLKNFQGKYVLINFWASWCVPCITEIKLLKNISKKYNSEKLIIISVSIDQNKLNFAKAVKKYGMDWINIYHDIELEKFFLKNSPIPQTYLIDHDGKLIYSRENERDYNLKKMMSILKNRI